LALQGPDDELKELGDTIDALLSRLEVSFEARHRFVANASHELRTPLTRQRAIGQVALADPEATTDSLRAAHERILVSGDQQERLIDALLTLAHGQAGIDVREPVDLADLVDDTIAARRTEAEQRSITVQSSIEPATVAGHRNLTERLVTNLIDNALRHNHSSGQLDIVLSTVDSCAVLTVGNTGPVVPAEEIDRLFQPFQRSQSGRAVPAKGFGLGLSIVEAVTQAHGGTVVATAPPTGGLVVTVTIPTA
jgi:signal transduction histidine kinase